MIMIKHGSSPTESLVAPKSTVTVVSPSLLHKLCKDYGVIDTMITGG
jgi:hypothetical protein